MRIVRCGRYPVKSLLGEESTSLSLDSRGVAFDRWWALRTPAGRFGSGKTTRRFVRMERLQTMSARLADTSAVITLPSGTACDVSDPAVHELVSEVVGQPVTVAPEGDVPHVDDSPIHLVSSASLRWIGASSSDWMIFRPNLVVDAAGSARVEDTWIGRRLKVGAALLEVTGPATRCVMIGDYLRRAPTFGVYARVLRPAVISLDDPVTPEE